MKEHHVVIGASGSIGNAVIRELVAQGRAVRGVSRRGNARVPDAVEMVGADANSLDDMRRALQEATVVYNCTNPAVQDAILDVAEELNVKVVLANNLYMYDPAQGAMSENSPIFYADREGGRFYDELAKQVIAKHRAGKIRSTVGRASDIFGKAVKHGYNRELIYEPAFAGKPASILGAADVPHMFAYADDVAKALIMLGTHDVADGEIWHLPAMEAVTQRQLLQMIYDEAGTHVKFRAANGFIMTILALFNAEMKKMKREKLYQFTTPWYVDSTKYERCFGRDVTDVRQAVKDTVAWFRENRTT